MQYRGKRVCTGNAEVQPKFALAKLIIFLHERAIPAGKNGQNGSVKGLDYYI